MINTDFWALLLYTIRKVSQNLCFGLSLFGSKAKTSSLLLSNIKLLQHFVKKDKMGEKASEVIVFQGVKKLVKKHQINQRNFLLLLSLTKLHSWNVLNPDMSGGFFLRENSLATRAALPLRTCFFIFLSFYLSSFPLLLLRFFFFAQTGFQLFFLLMVVWMDVRLGKMLLKGRTGFFLLLRKGAEGNEVFEKKMKISL